MESTHSFFVRCWNEVSRVQMMERLSNLFNLIPYSSLCNVRRVVCQSSIGRVGLAALRIANIGMVALAANFHFSIYIFDSSVISARYSNPLSSNTHRTIVE